MQREFTYYYGFMSFHKPSDDVLYICNAYVMPKVFLLKKFAQS